MAKTSNTYVYTIGEPGAGKTYQRCVVYLLKEFLPHGDPESVHWSNFPIVFDDRTFYDVESSNGKKSFEDEEEALDYAESLPGGAKIKTRKVNGLVSLAGQGGISEETVRNRVKVFPAEVVELCKNQDLKYGEEPYAWWHYFEDNAMSMSKCHIAIDEIQYYCGRRSSRKVQKMYEDFLGGGRHTGATFEFLTQAPDKVSQCIEMHTTVRILIEKGEGRRDPWFSIPNYDWYQIRYIITRKYNPTSWITEQRKQITGNRANWIDTESHFFWFKPEYFGAYDSYSLTEGTGGLKGAAVLPECKRFSSVKLTFWFLRKHWWRLMFNSSTGAIAFVVVLWFFAQSARTGGMNKVVDWLGPQTKKVEAGEVEAEKVRSFSLPAPDDPEKPKPISLKSVVDAELSSSIPASTPSRSFPVPRPSAQRKPSAQKAAETTEKDSGPSEEVMQQIEGLNREVEDLEKKLLDSSALVAISGERIVLRDGGAYDVGDKIEFGIYQGLNIEELDYMHRAVRLSDGRWLRLGNAQSWIGRFGANRGATDSKGDSKGEEPDETTPGGQ